MGGDDFSLRLRSEDIYVLAIIKKFTRGENMLRPTPSSLSGMCSKNKEKVKGLVLYSSKNLAE